VSVGFKTASVGLAPVARMETMPFRICSIKLAADVPKGGVEATILKRSAHRGFVNLKGALRLQERAQARDAFQNAVGDIGKDHGELTQLLGHACERDIDARLVRGCIERALWRPRKCASGLLEVMNGRLWADARALQVGIEKPRVLPLRDDDGGRAVPRIGVEKSRGLGLAEHFDRQGRIQIEPPLTTALPKPGPSEGLGAPTMPCLRGAFCPVAATNGRRAAFASPASHPCSTTAAACIISATSNGRASRSRAPLDGGLRNTPPANSNGRGSRSPTYKVREHGLERLAIRKVDKRYTPDAVHDAIETEALSQNIIVGIVRDRLDELLPEPLAVVLRRRARAARRLRLDTHALCGLPDRI
jgi:hypothetical protein